MVIGELDEIYYVHQQSKLKEDFKNNEFEIPIRNYEEKNIHVGLTSLESFVLRIERIINLIYDLVYFHIFPYSWIIFVCIFKNVRFNIS